MRFTQRAAGRRGGSRSLAGSGGGGGNASQAPRTPTCERMRKRAQARSTLLVNSRKVARRAAATHDNVCAAAGRRREQAARTRCYRANLDYNLGYNDGTTIDCTKLSYD
jgi:hypothetical protein